MTGPVTSSGSAPLRVCLLGLGTVASEVARGLVERGDELAERAGGRRLELVALGVRQPDRDRGISLPPSVTRSDDLAAISARDDVDVVVELLGGLEPAGGLIASILGQGRAVVTANKALLSRRGADLETAARRSDAPLRFEAAVCGAIPVLSPIARDLAANRWTELSGIVNGTTNFMLTAMADEGWSYEDALAEAQELGYAEAEPAADVEGFDAADKLAILFRLAFGAWPDVASIRRAPPAIDGDATAGITAVSPEHHAAAADIDLAIKLVARAARDETGRLTGAVVANAVPVDSPLGRTGGVTNLVELAGDPIGRVTFIGPGAGGAPTSSAVLADLIALARGEGSTWAALPPATASGPLPDGFDTPVRWFHATNDGSGAVTEPLTLDEARASLADARVASPLYPVVEPA
jgi:homoserine dehydrogenase